MLLIKVLKLIISIHNQKLYIEIKNLDNINDEVEFEKHDNPNQYGSSGGASDTDAHHLQHLDSDCNQWRR